MQSSNCYTIVVISQLCYVTSSEAREQVLANLANFAYDPKNMEHLRELQVADLFLDMLTEENDNFVEFGMGVNNWLSLLHCLYLVQMWQPF